MDFVGMEQFIEMLRGAQLLILHAGVGAVLQAIEAGHVPVVMPRRRAFFRGAMSGRQARRVAVAQSLRANVVRAKGMRRGLGGGLFGLSLFASLFASFPQLRPQRLVALQRREGNGDLGRESGRDA